MDIKQKFKLKHPIKDKYYFTINNDSANKNKKLTIKIHSLNHLHSNKRDSNSELKKINRPNQTSSNTINLTNTPNRQKGSCSFLTRLKKSQLNKPKPKKIINSINSGLVFNTIFNKYNNLRTETIENYINGGKKFTLHVKVKSNDFNTNGIKFNYSSIMKLKNKNSNNVINLNYDERKNTNGKLNVSSKSFYDKNITIEKIELLNKNKNSTFTIINKDNYKHFKNKRINKNIEQKRPAFSPTIDRDLLNAKQNSILNYSNRKKTEIKFNHKPTNTEIININDIISSPFKKGNIRKYPFKIKNNSKNHKLKQKKIEKNNIFNHAKNINKEIFKKVERTTPNKKQNIIIKKKTLQSIQIMCRKSDKKVIKNKKGYQNIINKNLLDEDPIMHTYTLMTKNIQYKSPFTKNTKTPEKKIEKTSKKSSKKNIVKLEKKIEEKTEEKIEEKTKDKTEIKEEKEEKEEKNLEEAADNLIDDMFSDLLAGNFNEESPINENHENDTTKNTLPEIPKKHMNQSKSQHDINPEFLSKKFSSEKKIIETEKKLIKSTDPENKKIIIMDSLCKKGFSGAGIKKINQDNFFMFKNFINNPLYIYFGVCDGHGIFGQDVSGYLVKNLPENLNQKFLEEKTIDIENTELYLLSKTLTKIFKTTNDDLTINKNVDTKFSGSTCTSLIFTPSRIITANVGDSRCVLGKFDGINWYSKNLTRDHKPYLKSEKKRILACNGRIEPCKDDDGEFIGPSRVWLKDENFPGLAMSRSFGDETAHLVGVICEPEILDYYFLHEDKFLIIASDGIWEFINSDDCVNIVKDYYLKNDVEGCVNFLYKEASKKWIMEEEVIDDITVILVFLN